MTGDSWLPNKFGTRPATIATKDVQKLDSTDLVYIAEQMEEFITDEANRDKWGVPGHSWSIFRAPLEADFKAPGKDTSFAKLATLEEKSRSELSKIYSCTGFANLDETGKPAPCSNFVPKFDVAKIEEKKGTPEKKRIAYSQATEGNQYSDIDLQKDALAERLSAERSLAHFCRTCNQVGDARAACHLGP